MPASTAGSSDAETVAFAEPEVVEIPCRADNRIAIGGVGNCAVVDLLDTDFRKCWYAVHGGFDVWRQALDVFLEQLVLGAWVRTVDITGRRTVFVRSQDESAVLLPKVPRAVRFS